MFNAKLIRIIVLGCLIILVVFTSYQNARSDGLLKIYFFDVGQGDSIFIETPNGNQILIDGGPDNSILQKLGEVMPLQDRDIDVLLVTHPHADHIGGLAEVLNRYRISSIIQAKEIYETSEYWRWQEAVNKEDTIEIEAIAGKELDLGSGVHLTILYPIHSVAGMATETPHDAMVVAKLQYGDTRVLFTGDMEADIERFLTNHFDIQADVLKVGHHGSKTSTTQLFLNAVAPQAAVIQVGAKNKYSHPSPQVLERLERNSLPYYRTDTNGDVELQTDGSTIVITSKK